MPRETLSETPAAPAPKAAGQPSPRPGGGGGAPKKRDVAPPPPPPPPPPQNPEEDAARMRDREVLDTRARMRAVEERQLREKGELFAPPTQFNTLRWAMSHPTQAPRVLHEMAARRDRAAAERAAYTVQSMLPEVLDLGPPKNAIRTNLTGTREGEVVVYPRGIEPSPEVLRNPAVFMSRVRELAGNLRAADEARAVAASRVKQAQRDPNRGDVRPEMQVYTRQLQAVADMRDSLRKMGYSEEEIDALKK